MWNVLANPTSKATKELVSRFIREHRLPASYAQLIDQHLLPLADWVAGSLSGSCRLLGINGAQGTGKSTIADFLRVVLETDAAKSVAVLSIDDFYLTRAERRRLGRDVHPLLETRGVPGTHDVAMLERCLSSLRTLSSGRQMSLPRFDKAEDDRVDESLWPAVTGPVSLIILEGWCVGSIAQSDAALGTPLNALERERDPHGRWRDFANRKLANEYMALFAKIDSLVFLRAPSFDAIYRWRLEQEQKLAASSPDGGKGLMTEDQIADFIQHYERITRHNLATLHGIADVTLELDEDHTCARSRYREHG